MNNMDRILQLFCLLSLFTRGYCEYACVCNYHASIYVYGTPSTMMMPIAALYRSECKEFVQQTNLITGWVAIAINHKVAYMKDDYQVQIKTCPGDPSPLDLLPTPSVPSETPPSSTDSFKSSTKTQDMKSSTTSSVVSMTPYVPSSVSPTSQPSITTPSLTGLSTTPTQVISGKIELCPENMLKMSTGVDLAQYGNHCYQYDPNEVIWQEAEYTCRSRGGHLADILSQAENDFIKIFLNDNSYFPVWIGFHDRNSEENFEWISDPSKPVTYTNWLWDRRTQYNGAEDCVVIGLDGQWDDKRCGQFATVDNLALGYGFICQYGITNFANTIVG